MKKDWTTVEILKHSRHDWLNKIQLIKGNLSLNKLDRVKEIIDEIVIETQNETKLTNLFLLSFASFLMTYNWDKHKFQLEYEVIGDTINLSSFDDYLTEWCIGFFTKLEESIDEIGDNHLSICIECQQDETRFFFDFSGIITNVELLHNWLEHEKISIRSLDIVEYQVKKEEMTVMISVK